MLHSIGRCALAGANASAQGDGARAWTDGYGSPAGNAVGAVDPASGR
jgi:hypothetical protein